MTNTDFSKRLSQLRIERNVSAREMSLDLGQSPGYINNIENGINLPSMTVFFYICEYLKITPKEFFDYETADPVGQLKLYESCKGLSPAALNALTNFMNEIKNQK